MVGTMSSLRLASAASEAASVPLPSTGSATVAIVPASFTSTVIGSCMCPVSSARHSSCPIASCTCERVDVGDLDDDAGRDLAAREGRLIRYTSERRAETAGTSRRRPRSCAAASAGTASASSSPAARTTETTGLAQNTVEDRAPDPTVAVVAAEPADERHASSIDTIAEPGERRRQDGQRPEHGHRDHQDRAHRERGQSPYPARNSPDMATITVRPEISTERPEVAAAAWSAASSLRPPPAPLALASSRTSSSRRRPRARSGGSSS